MRRNAELFLILSFRTCFRPRYIKNLRYPKYLENTVGSDKKRAPGSQLDTLDFLADHNSKQLPAQPFNGTLFEARLDDWGKGIEDELVAERKRS